MNNAFFFFIFALHLLRIRVMARKNKCRNAGPFKKYLDKRLSHIK